MKIIEQFSCPKSTATPSEDLVAVTAFYAAVIDGATPKTPCRTGGETPGHLAAAILGRAIASLPSDISARDAIDAMTAALAASRPAGNASESVCSDRPTASAVIYSVRRREIWQVGDCPFLCGGKEFRNEKEIDLILARRRAGRITQAIEDGYGIESLMTDDPGRRLIQPYITAQIKRQNSLCRHGFGVLDGTPVPDAYIRIHPIDDNIREIVLASDGYPRLFTTLNATEEYLHRNLASDPLCIGPLLATKGLRPGNLSFDDRSYLRISL